MQGIVYQHIRGLKSRINNDVSTVTGTYCSASGGSWSQVRLRATNFAFNVTISQSQRLLHFSYGAIIKLKWYSSSPSHFVIQSVSLREQIPFSVRPLNTKYLSRKLQAHQNFEINASDRLEVISDAKYLMSLWTLSPSLYFFFVIYLRRMYTDTKQFYFYSDSVYQFFSVNLLS